MFFYTEQIIIWLYIALHCYYFVVAPHLNQADSLRTITSSPHFEIKIQHNVLDETMKNKKCSLLLRVLTCLSLSSRVAIYGSCVE